MPKIELMPGDFFCTKNPMALGKAIRFMETFWKGHKAVYSHSGIITDRDGTSLEALWTIRGNSIDAYDGEEVIIGRWTGMTPEALQRGYEAIAEEIHEGYPFWRLFLFPALAKWVSSGNFTVCSELVCKFLQGAGFSMVERWQGMNPDDVADIIDKYRDITKIYEGVWKGCEKY
jgi:hypothetical protein